MYRIRFHGRGGHGLKTASRILGSALFLEGYEVQDAPRYGAERRGAPIFAYVRADRRPIYERGVIDQPDLVVVTDDSLLQTPAAGVRVGLHAASVLVLRTAEPAEVWRERLALPGPVVALAPAQDADELRAAHLFGVACTGAAARLLGVVARENLTRAIEQELGDKRGERTAASVRVALEAFDAMAAHGRCVQEDTAEQLEPAAAPDWIELPLDLAARSAPAIFGAATSVQVKTGLWRTLRPVIDHERCHHCHWMCALPCPDSAIVVDDAGAPQIDLDHCKGCLICVAQCPFHVIAAVPEHSAQAEERAEVREP